jgi:four helix bundle protein
MRPQTTDYSMSYRFEKLVVWQLARKFSVKIYKISREFPSDERFSLTDQLRRAAVSIVLNIAEGSDKKSDKEFVRYLRNSLGSLEEVVTALYIALDLKYINNDKFKELYKDSNILASKLNALIKSLKKL